jgi:hypothetical protein
MRIIFDQGTPKPLATYLVGHDVTLASQQNWSTLKNGELLTSAENAGFDLLITTDRNLAYQQNLKSRRIGVVVLGVGNWPRIERSVGFVVDAVKRARIGSYEEVLIP